MKINNKAKQVFLLLGIAPHEEFYIINKKGRMSHIKYKIDEDLRLYTQYSDYDPTWVVSKMYTIRHLLLEKIKIQKSYELTSTDEIVINYAMVTGCKYLTMDQDGTIIGHKNKPKKCSNYWWRQDDYIIINTLVSFLSPEDTEPYYLGEGEENL